MANRSGVTVVDLLVVVGVIALIAAISLPAIQAAREAGRKSQCLSNLHQIGVAMQEYADVHGTFPPSSSFQSAILPQLELENVYALINYSVPQLAPPNFAARRTDIGLFHCPSDGAAQNLPGTNYVGNFGNGVQAHGFNGVIRPLRGFYGIGESPKSAYSIAPAMIVDGLSRTAAISELLIALDRPAPRRELWQTPLMIAPAELDAFATTCDAMSGAPPFFISVRGTSWLLGDQSITGYNHILPPNRNSCLNGTLFQFGAFTAGSFHPGGVNLIFADGHGDFLSDSVDRGVWRALGSRNGNEAMQ